MKSQLNLTTDYITIERHIYEEMLKALHECRAALNSALGRLNKKETEEWYDGKTVCALFSISERTLQTMRSDGRIGFSYIDGKVYYPASEIGRLFAHSYIKFENDLQVGI